LRPSVPVAAVKALALSCGFDVVGITTADPFPEAEEAMLARLPHLKPLSWLTPARIRLACHPRTLMPSARSIVAIAARYSSVIPQTMPQTKRDASTFPYPVREGEEASEEQPAIQGRFARYAWGPDYHAILADRLRQLVVRLRELAGSGLEARVFVDTGPLAERAVALRAGLGWQGKNCTLLTPEHGSWVVLGEVLVNLELEPDVPSCLSLVRGEGKTGLAIEGRKGAGGLSGEVAPCAGCDLCLRACPTGALCAPRTVDVSRCLSYLTIEHRGAIPRDLRPALGNRVFGCDICQEVCLVNRGLEPPMATLFPPNPCLGPTVNLLSLVSMSEEDFRRRFANSAVRRAKRAGLRRNAAVALGNYGDERAIQALISLLKDPDPLLREHVAWALGRIGGSAARRALGEAWSGEVASAVRAEIEWALSR